MSSFELWLCNFAIFLALPPLCWPCIQAGFTNGGNMAEVVPGFIVAHHIVQSKEDYLPSTSPKIHSFRNIAELLLCLLF